MPMPRRFDAVRRHNARQVHPKTRNEKIVLQGFEIEIAVTVFL
jgi:hypothetical protein